MMKTYFISYTSKSIIFADSKYINQFSLIQRPIEDLIEKVKGSFITNSDNLGGTCVVNVK